MCAHYLPTTATASLCKLHGLHAADVHVTTLALQAATTGWTLDQHHDSDGDLMLMITPPGDEHTTPTFVLSGTAAGVHLDVALGDSCDSLGTFADVRQAAIHARQVMTASTADVRAAV